LLIFTNLRQMFESLRMGLENNSIPLYWAYWAWVKHHWAGGI